MTEPAGGQLLRILDANGDRAREALRVLEDYCRFALDHADLSARLKEIRHDLTAALAGFEDEAILHRDTPGDVGTINKTSIELNRADVAHVVRAAGKRLGEALRAIEEFLKILNPESAGRVEAIRYRFYAIEQAIARTLGRGVGMWFVRLYVLVTESVCARPWLEVAEEAILGGADCVQLREKDMEAGELLRRARQLVDLCRRHDVISIINDRPDIALLADADGVHVGQGDLPCAEVRKIVGNRKIVGVSTHSIEQARQAVLDGADYIGVGPVYPSGTKPRDILPGLEYARQAGSEIQIPTIAIAGIDVSNVDAVIKTGVTGVAVTAAVCNSPTPRAAAEGVRQRMVAQPGPPTNRADGGAVGPTFLSVASGHSCPGDEPGGFNPESHVTKRRRHLPHWTMEGATYFLTFRVASSPFSASEAAAVLQHIVGGHGKFYELYAAVVMPDHAHLLLKPTQAYDLSRIVKGTKGVSAKIVNDMRRTQGTIWLDEASDRVMRDLNDFREKLEYIYSNPVAAGLVSEPEDYPALFILPDR